MLYYLEFLIHLKIFFVESIKSKITIRFSKHESLKGYTRGKCINEPRFSRTLSSIVNQNNIFEYSAAGHYRRIFSRDYGGPLYLT